MTKYDQIFQFVPILIGLPHYPYFIITNSKKCPVFEVNQNCTFYIVSSTYSFSFIFLVSDFTKMVINQVVTKEKKKESRKEICWDTSKVL